MTNATAPRVLLSEEAIKARIAELAAAINRDYAGQTLHALGVLKGSFVFMADLLREINIPVTCDFLTVSSYGESTESSGIVQMVTDLTVPITGKNVLIIEDIVDTGLTLRYLYDNLATRNPKTLRICTLLHKPARRRVDVPVTYLGFTIPDEFVVGYGLDNAGYDRNLRYIGVLDI